MWPPRLRHACQMLLYYAAPVAVVSVGVHLLYRATQLEGTSSNKAFTFGLILITAERCWWWARSTRRRSAGEEQFLDSLQNLCKRVRSVENEVNAIRIESQSKLAAKAVLEATDRSEAHRSETWVHYHKGD